jgi:hypothetical protein
MDDGFYLGTAKAGQLAEAKTGTTQMVVTFDVTHKSSNGAWEPLGTPIERDIFLATSEAAWPYTEKKLQALGFDGNFNAPTFATPQTTLLAKLESYDGKSRLKWDVWTEREKPEYKLADTDTQRRLMARWKQNNPSAAPKPATPPVPAATATQAPEGDIPF